MNLMWPKKVVTSVALSAAATFSGSMEFGLLDGVLQDHAVSIARRRVIIGALAWNLASNALANSARGRPNCGL